MACPVGAKNGELSLQNEEPSKRAEKSHENTVEQVPITLGLVSSHGLERRSIAHA